jgi:diphthamide biosynthesis protein 2
VWASSLHTPVSSNRKQLLCGRSCRTTRRCGCRSALWSRLYEQVSHSILLGPSKVFYQPPRNYRLPVIYVFGKKPVDVEDAAKMLWESFYSSDSPTKFAVLKHDIAYTHEAGASCDPYASCDMFLIPFAERILSALQDIFSKHEITVSYSPIPRKLGPSNAASTTATADHDGAPLGDDDSQDTTPVLYVGSPSLALTNLLLTHSATPVRTYLRTP